MFRFIIKIAAVIIIWEVLTGCASLPLPDLNTIPPDTFIGIAENTSSLEDCRRKAIVSAAEQIALNVSTDIQVKYQKTTRLRLDSISRTVEDSYKHLSEIILGDVVSNTEKVSFKKRFRSYSCYIVVRYPRSRIEKLRKEARSINELRRRIRREEQEKFLAELGRQRDYYKRRDRRLEGEINELRETVENDSWINKKELKRKISNIASRGYNKFQDAWYQFRERYESR